jgi:hypothetical protein
VQCRDRDDEPVIVRIVVADGIDHVRSEGPVVRLIAAA